MATKSIFKDVVVRDKDFGKRLARALEDAKGKKAKDVTISKMVREPKGEELKKLFGSEK